MSYRTGNRVDAVDVQGVPAPPRQCGVYGCDHDAQVLFVVANRGGRTHTGAFAEFCNDAWSANGKCHREPKPGVEFVRWIARCAECYQRDVDRARKGKWNYAPPGTERPVAFLAEPRP